jgi:hypothetical protein
MATRILRTRLLQILLISATLIVCRSGGGDEPPVTSSEDTFDVDANGIPKFAGVDYVELSKIHRISKFRSSVGHDYWDDFEHCRSMKHYFEPKDTVNWSTVKIWSPVKGTVFRMYQEWAGTQVQIKSDANPAFYFIIFHITLSDSLRIGDKLSAGQLLGTHFGSATMSDIAVGVSTPKGWKLVSYFDVMTDSVFHGYQLRGLSSRSDVTVTKTARDSDTLRCDSDTFLNTGTLENWVTLN